MSKSEPCGRSSADPRMRAGTNGGHEESDQESPLAQADPAMDVYVTSIFADEFTKRSTGEQIAVRELLKRLETLDWHRARASLGEFKIEEVDRDIFALRNGTVKVVFAAKSIKDEDGDRDVFVLLGIESNIAPAS